MNNNQKNLMIASNRKAELILILLMVMSLGCSSATADSGFKQFNRAIAAGTRIIWSNCFMSLPCDVLEEGENIPNSRTWQSHSTLTTGLFKLNTGSAQHWKFSTRGDSTVVSGPQLWLNIRYYNENSVLLGNGNAMMVSVGKKWVTFKFNVDTKNKEAVYAEIYLVKYAELDDNLDAVQAIYIADLRAIPSAL
ncbi:MAG: hypothetical protein KAH22_08820 [Thiotrichaceae bacterium]|nr:hypothetical protein [Thiotrichaceae bacterium]